eukprot:TRINITY_DN31610_c0_g1_i1.p1 TRINITY_DN31610_c0_g1~~TRINITY_DN31610_c0_g1_i1.p1  ORF type:complete len:125 (+),score=9.17 TRINITY_DN31610_c0_g1_i1:119-493(+)
MNLGVAPTQNMYIHPYLCFAPTLNSPSELFTLFVDSFTTHDYFVNPTWTLETPIYHITTILENIEIFWKGPVLVLLVQIITSWVAYIFGKFACKGKIQDVVRYALAPLCSCHPNLCHIPTAALL